MTERPAAEPRVVIVTFDTAQILDVTGPLEVFSSASRFLPSVRYRTEVVTVDGGPVMASCGLEFASSPIGEVVGPVDTVMVAGGADMDAAAADEQLLHHVRRLAADARRVTSVCSGAFVLAAAGLLEGRRATTHWAECDLLDATYADVTVDADAIYVHDGNVWTSAGVTAGIDLALALVADDHGHGAAATVARQLVVYLQRSGGQAQFSALLAGQAADTEPVRDLLAWLRDHLADDLSVAALARQINLSERQFTRVFKAEVGATAADHVEAVRLDSACRLLESTNRTIEQIARDLRLRNTRDDEPHLPQTPQHDPRRTSPPLPRRQVAHAHQSHHLNQDLACRVIPPRTGVVPWSPTVVVSAGCYPNLVIADFVDESVFIGDSSRPIGGEVVLEGLRLADALVAVAHDVLDQQIDSLEDLSVLSLPPEVVFPGVDVPDQPHSQSASTRS